MPLLSVTVIGLMVGVVLVVRRRTAWPGTTARAVAGAWLGFIAGAILGVLIDIVSGTGAGVAVMGHYLAVAGSVAAVVPPHTP